MILTKKEVAIGEVPPMGYARAWDCWDKDASVFYPFPLNIPAAWGRAFWHYLKFRTSKQSALDDLQGEAWEQGYKTARENLQASYDSMKQDLVSLGYMEGFKRGKDDRS